MAVRVRITAKLRGALNAYAHAVETYDAAKRGETVIPAADAKALCAERWSLVQHIVLNDIGRKP